MAMLPSLLFLAVMLCLRMTGRTKYMLESVVNKLLKRAFGNKYGDAKQIDVVKKNNTCVTFEATFDDGKKRKFLIGVFEDLKTNPKVWVVTGNDFPEDVFS